LAGKKHYYGFQLVFLR